MTDPEPHALDEKEMALWQAFLQASILSLEGLNRALSELDLTLEDYEILVFLSEADDRQLAMSDLADRTLSAKSRLTYRVDRLERAGFVERVRCESDGRRVWATLTPQGFAMLEKAWPTHLASVRRFVVEPVADGDVAAATRALEEMTKAIRGAKCDE
jgi:DNA-binding MarR family transcriptional regulator